MEFSPIWPTITPNRLCFPDTDTDTAMDMTTTVMVTVTNRTTIHTAIQKITVIVTQRILTVLKRVIPTKVTTESRIQNYLRKFNH